MPSDSRVLRVNMIDVTEWNPTGGRFLFFENSSSQYNGNLGPTVIIADNKKKQYLVYSTCKWNAREISVKTLGSASTWKLTAVLFTASVLTKQ